MRALGQLESQLRRIAVGALEIGVGLMRPRGRSTAVIVLGMHRSGTSAVTGLLAVLGVNVGDDAELIDADAANQRGYWESARLTDFQELLLQRLGGSWDDPPRLPDGWADSPWLVREVGRARRLVKELYGQSEKWAWKDPRTSLLLPFWRRALAARIVVVVIHRNPLEVAASLTARDGFSKQRGLGLWESYNRALLEDACGLPALVVGYDSLVSDPVGVANRLRNFLATHGISTQPAYELTIDAFIDRDLRHATRSDGDLASDPDVSEKQRALQIELRRLEQLGEALHSSHGLGRVIRTTSRQQNQSDSRSM